MPATGLGDATLGALTLKQCSEATLSPNISLESARGSGNVAPDAIFVASGTPVASFTSRDVSAVLGANTNAFAGSGLGVSSGTITIPLRIRTTGGTYASGGAHTTLNGTDGLIVPTSLNIPGNGFASIGLDCHYQSTDGQAAPVGISTTVAVSNGAFNRLYRMHPVSLDGSAVAGVSSVTVNFGFTLEHSGDVDGFVYPTEHYITATDPTIDINFKDATALATHGPLFTAQNAAVINLRRAAEGGTVVATATAEHITLTFGAGIKTVETIGNSGNTRGEYTLRLTGETLTVSTTATL